MSLSVGMLQNEQEDANTVLKDLGFVGKPLTIPELTKFSRSFERQWSGEFVQREISEVMNKHRAEIVLGAMIAKEQMDAEIDGETPQPGKIGGPVPIRAAFLGIGDGWEDIDGIYSGAQSTWSTGSAQDWIHSGTTLLAGTDGNAIKVLENAVHVIIGMGSYNISPKIEALKFTIDGKERPIYQFPNMKLNQNHNLRLKEFDTAVILKKNTTFKAELFIPRGFGSPSAFQQDFPYLLGASFIREENLREMDPANIPGTGPEVITTT